MLGLKMNTTMDKLRQKAFSESIRKTLNCYQLASADSLSGPSGYPAIAAQLWFKENKESPPVVQLPPLIQIPLLIPNDTSTQRSEAFLRGERIVCFIVGGEKRLCLAQILTSVLRDYSISEINRTCAELHIYCSRCTPDQLAILKMLDVLPFNTTQCGLITKSDAERLVSSLDVEYSPKAESDLARNLKSGKSKRIKVYHECFGRGYGYFFPDLYVAPDAACIACVDCRITLPPSRFVTHSHHGLEKRTCHWGFDPNHWRRYILLPEDTDASLRKGLERQLDSLKGKFEPPESTADSSNSSLKRRTVTPELKVEHGKRRKVEEPDREEFLSPKPSPPVNLGFPFGVPPSLLGPFNVGVPQGLPYMSKMQSVHQDAVIKTLASGMQERSPPRSAKPSSTPNIVPTHKRTSSCTREEEKSKDASRGKKMKNRDKSPKTPAPQVKIEAPESLRSFHPHHHPDSFSASLNTRQIDEEQKQHSSNIHIATSDRPPNDPLSMKKRLARESSDKLDAEKPQEEAVNLSNHLHQNRRRNDKVVDVANTPQGDNKITSRIQEDKDDLSLVAMSNAVAAASAMLELSASVKNSRRIGPSSSPQHQTAPPTHVRKSPVGIKVGNKPSSNPCPEASHPSVYPMVSTVGNQMKWAFQSSSYLISACGSQELTSFQRLLDRVEKSSLRTRLLEEVVKMMSRIEEKLDSRISIHRETERELEHMKTSLKQHQEDAASGRRELINEIEQIRHEHHRYLADAKQSFLTLGRQIADVPRHPNGHERETLQHKILEKLHKRIDEREEAKMKLEAELQEETERRVEAEKRLEELVRGGRTALLGHDASPSFVMRSLKDRDGSPVGGCVSTEQEMIFPLYPPYHHRRDEDHINSITLPVIPETHLPPPKPRELATV